MKNPLVPAALLFMTFFLFNTFSFSETTIWMIHDLAKINPRTGDAYEAGDLYASALPGSYKDQNMVWSSGARTLSLRALKDEVVAFQIIIHSPDPVAVESLSFSNLMQGKALLPASLYTPYREWSSPVTKPSWNNNHGIMSFGPGWYPCQLIPMNDPGLRPEYRFPIRIPDPMNRIDGQTAMAFWVDLYVPDTAAPGKYGGSIVIRVSGLSHTFKVALEVGRHRIPAENHSNFTAICRGIRPVYNFEPALVKEINFLFHSHRVDLDPYNYYPETEGRGDSLKIFWDRYVFNEEDHLGSVHFERDILPYLRPAIFTPKNGYHGPAKNCAPGWITLPLQVGWFKRKGIDMDSPDYWPTFKQACRLTFRKFKEWKITQRRMVYINKADEPHDLAALNLGRDHGDTLAKIAREERDSVEYRMDIGSLSEHHARRFNKAWTPDSLVTHFHGNVGIWCLNPGLSDFPKESGGVAGFLSRHPGTELWIYQSNTSGEPAIGNVMSDCENIGIPAWPWAQWIYKLGGGMFWEALYYEWPPETAWKASMTSEKEFAITNNDAAALFRGDSILKRPSFVPAIRLKLIRRGNQDYEYFYLLSKKTGNDRLSDSLARSVMPKALWEADPGFKEGDWRKNRDGTLHPEDKKFRYLHGKWSHNPEDWVRARYAAFDMLEGRY